MFPIFPIFFCVFFSLSRSIELLARSFVFLNIGKIHWSIPLWYIGMSLNVFFHFKRSRMVKDRVLSVLMPDFGVMTWPGLDACDLSIAKQRWWGTPWGPQVAWIFCAGMGQHENSKIKHHQKHHKKCCRLMMFRIEAFWFSNIIKILSVQTATPVVYHSHHSHGVAGFHQEANQGPSNSDHG